jgi:hypothetical protein
LFVVLLFIEATRMSEHTQQASEHHWAGAPNSILLRGALRQEDMISYGFNVRVWQTFEAGKPIPVLMLLVVCGTAKIPIEEPVSGLGSIPTNVERLERVKLRNG